MAAPMVFATQVLAGQGRGQWVTVCRHPDCAGRTVAVDLTYELATGISVPQHAALHTEHE